MSEINLMPEQDRQREQRERSAHAGPEKSPLVSYTAGQRAPSKPLPRGNFLWRLFARKPKDLPMPAPEVPISEARSHAAGEPPPPPKGNGAGTKTVEAASAPPRPPTPSPEGTLKEKITAFFGQGEKIVRRSKSEEEFGKPPVTSLLPKEYLRSSRHALAYIQLALALLTSSGIVALLFWVVLQYEIAVRAQLETQKNEVAVIEREIASRGKARGEATTLQRRVDAAQTLLDRHLRWTKTLAFLEAKTVPDVRFMTLAVDAKTTRLSLDAVGASFSALARQLALYQQTPEVKAISITSGEVKGEQREVAFQVQLELFPEVIQDSVEEKKEEKKVEE